MIARTTSASLPAHAPAILMELREAFDARLTGLYGQALERMAAEDHSGPDRTVHVPFEHQYLTVVAVYHVDEDRFTQLIARDTTENGLERPSYTLSLFL